MTFRVRHRSKCVTVRALVGATAALLALGACSSSSGTHASSATSAGTPSVTPVGSSTATGTAATSASSGSSAGTSAPSGTSDSAALYSQSHPFPDFPNDTKTVHLTWWTWTANTASLIALFEKAYPNITVTAENPGAGAPTYTKLHAALSAGTGAPDVAQVNFDTLPEFAATKKLVDLTPYVVQYKSYYQSSIWNLADLDNKIEGVPYDFAPYGFAYRPDIFQKYGLTVPTTADEYSADALKLHAANPKMYMGEFAVNDASSLEGALWQAGISSFQQVSGSTWKVTIDTPAAQQVMAYWGNLISKGAVLPVAWFTPPDSARIAAGVYASYWAPYWGWPYIYSPNIKAGAQTFTLTAPPSWGGKQASASTPATTWVVPSQSQHPAEAALFASWIGLAEPAVNHLWDLNGGGSFPAANSRMAVAQSNQTSPLVPNANLGSAYNQYAATVPTGITWSPWGSFFNSTVADELSKAVAGTEPWSAVLTNTQSKVIAFAKSEGYTIQN